MSKEIAIQKIKEGKALLYKKNWMLGSSYYDIKDLLDDALKELEEE